MYCFIESKKMIEKLFFSFQNLSLLTINYCFVFSDIQILTALHDILFHVAGEKKTIKK